MRRGKLVLSSGESVRPSGRAQFGQEPFHCMQSYLHHEGRFFINICINYKDECIKCMLISRSLPHKRCCLRESSRDQGAVLPDDGVDCTPSKFRAALHAHPAGRKARPLMPVITGARQCPRAAWHRPPAVAVFPRPRGVGGAWPTSLHALSAPPRARGSGVKQSRGAELRWVP